MTRVLICCLIFACPALPGIHAAPPEFKITTIGPIDADHTFPSTNKRRHLFPGSSGSPNAAGQAVITAEIYSASGSVIGTSAWLSDSTGTIEVGLLDAEHSNLPGRSNSSVKLNEAGQASGRALRYEGPGYGSSVWFFDGSQTIRVSLADAEHTRSTDNRRDSQSGIAPNEAGQVTGYSTRYQADGAHNGRSGWLYDGSHTVTIGLTDAEHTYSVTNRYENTPLKLNNAGQVMGLAKRFPAGEPLVYLGQSAWLYDDDNTVNIGMTDAEHTNSTDNTRYSHPRRLNEAGQVIGYSKRYFTSGEYLGDTAWLYDGNSTVNIGLTDDEHSHNLTRSSRPYWLNEAGQVAGTAIRYDDASASEHGLSAWLYDGSTTINIGLTDAEHTRSSGYRWSFVRFLNETGQAAGQANLYLNSGISSAYSAWLFDGTGTVNIGLTDAVHTRNSGIGPLGRFSDVKGLNEAGQAVGFSFRYNAAGQENGRSAWFYNGSNTIEIGPLSVRSADGYAFSDVTFLGEDGLVLGTYTLFDEAGNTVGDRAFLYREEVGVFDLGSLVDDSFVTENWTFLETAMAANQDGSIVGTGRLNDMSSGQVAFLLTPVQPPLALAVTYSPEVGTKGQFYWWGGLNASGGEPPYTWDIVAGWIQWPLTLAQNGVILGTPAEASTAYFTVQVTDANSATATIQSQITVKQPGYVCGSCHSPEQF